jgi:hypothetical protein
MATVFVDRFEPPLVPADRAPQVGFVVRRHAESDGGVVGFAAASHPSSVLVTAPRFSRRLSLSMAVDVPLPVSFANLVVPAPGFERMASISASSAAATSAGEGFPLGGGDLTGAVLG